MVAAGVPHIVTRFATGDMRAYLYHIVRGSMSNDGKVALATGVGTSAQSAPLGILHTLRMGRDGESVGVGVAGPSKCIAGTAIAVDQMVTVGASGRAVPAGSGDFVIGQAMQPAAAAGDYFEVYLNRPYRASGV